jgi:hypothetical protein
MENASNQRNYKENREEKSKKILRILQRYSNSNPGFVMEGE